MKTDRTYITDFIGIDLLRFFLSLFVVLRHYYLFYYGFVDLGTILTIQPYFGLLGFFYKYGHYAVQVFWLISGLIFYSIYYKEIATAKIDFRKFAFLRFTRLYPLHLATLLIVAALQLIYFSSNGTYFAVQSQDVKHFFLQLFFMGSWYPAFEHSFNIPAWSVSIEIIVYVIYFLVALGGFLKGRGLYMVIVVTLVFNFFGILDPFDECLAFFFFGCMLARLISAEYTILNLLIKYGLASVGLAFVVGIVHRYFPNLPQRDVQSLIDLPLIPLSSCAVLMVIFAFRGITSKRVIKAFRSIGNMTYSLYLIHFPIQLTIVLVVDPTDHSIYNAPLTLFSFVAISIVAGWLVYEYFEKPVQVYLRNKFGEKRPIANSIPDAGQHN